MRWQSILDQFYSSTSMYPLAGSIAELTRSSERGSGGARSGTKSQRAFLQISSEYICKFSYPQGRKPPVRLLNTSGDFRKGVDLCESAGCTIRFRSGWSWSPTINARAPQNGSQEHVLHIHGGVPGRCRGTPGRCQRQQRRRQRQNQHAAGSAHSARTRQRRCG